MRISQSFTRVKGTNVFWKNDHFWVVALMVIGVVLRLWCLWSRDLWHDEIYQFTSMKGAFKPFWQHHTYGDHTAFPGEYLLHYPFVQIFGMNKWALAIPHMLFMAWGFWLLYALCRIWGMGVAGVIAAFVVYVFNGNLIFHALEFRPYAVLPVLAMASLYFSERILSGAFKEWRGWQTAFWGILFVFGMGYHAYGFLIMGLPFLYAFLDRKFFRGGLRIELSGGIGFFLGLVILLGGVIWVWYASFSNMGLSSNMIEQARPDVFEFIENPLVAPHLFMGRTFANLVRSIPGYVLVLLAIGSFLGACQEKGRRAFFFIGMVLLPIMLIFAVDLLNHYWFLHRQFVWVMPFMALWIGWCLDEFSKILKQRTMP